MVPTDYSQDCATVLDSGFLGDSSGGNISLLFLQLMKKLMKQTHNLLDPNTDMGAGSKQTLNLYKEITDENFTWYITEHIL